jgi:SAM-dependent methyltransferase
VADTRGQGEFWTARTVAWYQRADSRSDYAAQVLAAIPDLLAGCRSALDVGAGFGALALPLARRLDRVTALEPAAAMAAALRRAAQRESLGNVTVLEAPWGQVPVAPHDLVVCAHVGPLLRPGAPFLSEVQTVARRRVLLVRDASGGDDKFFFGELYPLLLGRPYVRCGHDGETVAALHALGIEPAVTTIEYRSDQPFDSLDEACDFWMTYMGLAGAEARARLRAFLRARLRREGRGWLAPFRKRVALVHWEPRAATVRTRSCPGSPGSPGRSSSPTTRRRGPAAASRSPGRWG